MNIKERIEKIKRKQVFEIENKQDFIRVADIVWLLKMAEVNEKWSEQLSELNQFLRGRADDIQEGHQTIYVAMELIRRLEKENQRYKQALEFYADKKTYELSVKISMGTAFPCHEPIKYDKGEKARKALEGEE